jgi:hypothetical protein
MGLAPLPRHELAVEYESGWEAAQLRQDGRHVPAPAAADVQAVLRRNDRPKAVPLQLEGPFRAGGQWPSARQHRIMKPQDENATTGGSVRFRREASQLRRQHVGRMVDARSRLSGVDGVTAIAWATRSWSDPGARRPFLFGVEHAWAQTNAAATGDAGQNRRQRADRADALSTSQRSARELRGSQFRLSVTGRQTAPGKVDRISSTDCGSWPQCPVQRGRPAKPARWKRTGPGATSSAKYPRRSDGNTTRGGLAEGSGSLDVRVRVSSIPVAIRRSSLLVRPEYSRHQRT